MKKYLFLSSAFLFLFTFTKAQPNLIGMCSEGGIQFGSIFNYTVGDTVLSNVYGLDGYRDGSLLLASNGKFYGVTTYGGAFNSGSLFEFDFNSNTYTKKFDFTWAIGINPSGSLMEASNGKLYGTTEGGGIYGDGILFEFDIVTNILSKKIDIHEEAFYACGSLIEASNGKFYGLASGDIQNWSNYGYLYEYNPSTNYMSFVHTFLPTHGLIPYGSLIEATNGKIYGVTSSGAAFNAGSIFEFDYTTHTVTNLHSFQSSIDGGNPHCSLFEASNGKLYGMTKYGGAFNGGTIFEFDYTSNTFTKKIDLTLTQGIYPSGSLMEASNGKLYGITHGGGLHSDGVLFEYDFINNTYAKQIDFNFLAIGPMAPNATLLEVNCVAPAITPSGPTSFCQGGSVTLNATNTPGGTYQWNRNGNLIAGATNQSLLVTNPGRYSVTVSDSTCNNSLTSGATRVTIPCIDPFDPQEKIALDENNSDATGITIFFDANLKVLSVKGQNIRGKGFAFSIYDNSGKLVLTENGVIVNSEIDTQINCSSFANGLFISKLTTEQEQLVKKFVIN